MDTKERERMRRIRTWFERARSGDVTCNPQWESRKGVELWTWKDLVVTKSPNAPYILWIKDPEGTLTQWADFGTWLEVSLYVQTHFEEGD